MSRHFCRMDVTEYWAAVGGSLRLDVGRHNHLAPFLGLVGDEFAEISGRACKYRAAQIGKPCLEFWFCNADIDFLVQSFDELYGRALRSTNAEPCTCLVVRQRVAQNRNVRQHIRPRRGGYGQGAESPAVTSTVRTPRSAARKAARTPAGRALHASAVPRVRGF